MSASDNPGYEKRDVNVKKIVGYTIASIVLLVVILVLLNEYFIFEREDMIHQQKLKPESAKLRDLRASEDVMLNTYKVLDPSKGIYQIPIERAIKVVADEAFEKSAANPKK